MKYLLASILLFGSFLSFSQQFMNTHDPREIKSLLNKENVLNAFGGADIKVTDIMKERAMIVGGYGGLLINHNYMFGVAGYGIATNPEFDGFLPDGTEKKLNIHGGYAGLLIGVTILSRELIHLSIPIVLGVGQVQISDEDFFQNSISTDFTIESSTFFVGEPAAELEFNITRTFRIAAGASYRLVEASELNNLSDEDLTNWTAMVSFRFGRF